ncbi:MAG: Holliday junction branch migration protein RuvA [[Clostridium] spiroforme]|uniref:Holliday junction branch migration complex subunit RuvA n=1 Tax=Thomasclavelia spiroformis TaxID=29348 RepID=A0A943EJG9_9FIRM|nr:Holliday junction branch migration protein RuvA [Thomasclavelia spiroformis]MBS5587719.1 Holliday junction branch migration protein RuvA [Thomasclavelia spiroformis]
MYSYIIGKIVAINIDHIVVENNGIGYLIYVSNPYEFVKGKEIKIYLYQYVKEDVILLYGFKTIEEKEMFLKLILVKGIGCKTAIGILATGDLERIISAIETNDVNYLKKIPGIGPKAAKQIILDLQGKFNDVPIAIKTNDDLQEALEVLIALGYRKVEVDKALKILANENLDTNGYVKRALSLLVK